MTICKNCGEELGQTYTFGGIVIKKSCYNCGYSITQKTLNRWS